MITPEQERELLDLVQEYGAAKVCVALSYGHSDHEDRSVAAQAAWRGVLKYVSALTLSPTPAPVGKDA